MSLPRVPTPYPRQVSVRSLADGICIGNMAGDTPGSTSPATVDVTENVLINGRRGTGTTVAAHTVVAGVLQCRDAIVWDMVVDDVPSYMPGAMRSAIDRPGVEHLLAEVYDLIEERKNYYKDMLKAHSWGRLPFGGADEPTCHTCHQPHPRAVVLVAHIRTIGSDAFAEHIARSLVSIAKNGPAVAVFTVVVAGGDVIRHDMAPLVEACGARVLTFVDAPSAKMLGIEYDNVPNEIMGKGVGLFRPNRFTGYETLYGYLTTREDVEYVAGQTYMLRPSLIESSPPGVEPEEGDHVLVHGVVVDYRPNADGGETLVEFNPGDGGAPVQIWVPVHHIHQLAKKVGPEPEDGSWVLCDFEPDVRAFRRNDIEAGRFAPTSDAHWQDSDTGEWLTWPEAWSAGACDGRVIRPGMAS